MTADLIKPRTLRGFRDHLPAAMLARERLIDVARRVYRSYGYSPIDTPALEYSEVLLGNVGGETEKQVFRFEDQGGRDVAMRFDLTVPFARYAARHIDALGTPFKRYHVGTVWRGERPAKGRYREFVQCDFDTIGASSNAADIETLLVIHDLFDAVGCEFGIADFAFTIHVNNRMVLNGLLEVRGLLENSTEILRILDKLPKIGRDAVEGELIEGAGLTREDANYVHDLASICVNSISGAKSELNKLRGRVARSEIGREGVERLEELFEVCSSLGIRDDRLTLNISIARGLDYYTGTIYETFLGALPGIGSVCSGGRYDNLAGLYTSRELPGVGASLGLDRLLAALEELGCVPESATPADVLIAQFDAQFLPDY
ncbi:MAG: histidine--tRNA ligase, partial [Planctomycetaceae bacterium]